MKRLTKKEKAAIEKRCYLIIDASNELRNHYPTAKIFGAIKNTTEIRKAALEILAGLREMNQKL